MWSPCGVHVRTWLSLKSSVIRENEPVMPTSPSTRQRLPPRLLHARHPLQVDFHGSTRWYMRTSRSHQSPPPCMYARFTAANPSPIITTSSPTSPAPVAGGFPQIQLVVRENKQ